MSSFIAPAKKRRTGKPKSFFTPSFNQRGFTFIEVIVSLAVVLIAVISVIQLFPLGARVGKNAEQNTTAVAQAQSKLEELTSLPYSDVGVGTLENHQQISLEAQSVFFYYFSSCV